MQQMEKELAIKMQLAEQKFGYDMQLAQLDVQKGQVREKMIEDRKDQRSKLEATQQSQLIQQREYDLTPTDFSDQPNGGSPMDQAML
jgi:hypothetical protein